MIKNFWQNIHNEIIYHQGKLLRNRLYNYEQLNSPIPFFIISAGRSGTTLLRKKLIQGGIVHIPPESDDNLPVLIKLFIKNIHKSSWHDRAHMCIDAFQNSDCFKYWDIDLTKNIDNLLKLDTKDQIRGFIPPD
jgi:hypothetical protein